MKTKKSGFTIVELLVVIVVIGILAAITIVSYTGISNRATVASLQSDLSNASTQLKIFQVDNGKYPDTIDCGIADSNTNKCLKVSNGNAYSYYQVNNSVNPQNFILHASKNSTYYRISNDSKPAVINPVVATGGTVTDVGNYRIHTFTTNGTLTVTTPGDAEVLVVAGGGGGSFGGGGAGGYLYGIQTLTGSMTVVVGNGGAGGVGAHPTIKPTGVDGDDSSFGTFSANGGGGGGSSGGGGNAGGSGGGSGPWVSSLANATPVGQGHAGGANGGFSDAPMPAGGGGGAGENGHSAPNVNSGGNGGFGINNNITGAIVGYAGGGGGGGWVQVTNGVGTHGGGTANATTSSATAVGGNGTNGTGGGGGGSNAYSLSGGNGGSGIVIIRYLKI